ncbi:hypothetical protein GCM10027049_21870 [Mucilaginibacter puniceus]
MKSNYLLFACLFCSVIYSCQNPGQTSNEATVKDTRPKDQIYFLNKVKADRETHLFTNNATVRDSVKAAFNKYAVDSLKKIQSWEMMVDEVNDNISSTSSVAEVTFDKYNTPLYNLKLITSAKVDNPGDTIAYEDRTDYTYTLPKNPTDDFLKKQLAIIKTLTYGDTVIVSGSLTHIKDGKIDFTSLFDESWNLDILITDIKKKGQK